MCVQWLRRVCAEDVVPFHGVMVSNIKEGDPIVTASVDTGLSRSHISKGENSITMRVRSARSA